MAKAKRAKEEHVQIEMGSGNVFEDLGLPDAGERLAKAELARVIRNIVKDKNRTQRRAADVLGIAPPDGSDLMRGKLARSSQERLERFLNALDMDVHIRVGPRAAGKKQASVTVDILWSGRRLRPTKPVARVRSSRRTVADLVSENRE